MWLSVLFIVSDELYGDFEDLETGEVHSGKTDGDDSDDAGDGDDDGTGEKTEDSKFVVF